MKRVRYLPPGSMRRQRRLGRIEGSLMTALIMIAMGAATIAATPPELLTRATYTERPAAHGEAYIDTPLALPPCIGQGKDCMPIEPAAHTAAPHQHQARHVPEPGTLALIGAAMAAALWRRS